MHDGLAAALVRIGVTEPPADLPAAFAGRGPRTTAALVAGTRPPRLADWVEVGTPVREVHTDFAESAQGVATDGQRWFVVSNRAVVGMMRKVTDPRAMLDRRGNTRRVGVYSLDGTKQAEVGPDDAIWAELLRLNRAGYPRQAVHLGDPTWCLGHLLVPTQRPSGVWVLSGDLADQDWWPDPAPTRPERFSWVAREPGTGLLYTSLHWSPDRVQAVEWQTLQRVPAADLMLGASDLLLDRVQGGAFTDAGRLLLTSSAHGGQVFCYSALNGHFFGSVGLGRFHELEGIAVHPCEVDGQRADVHVLDAGTDYWPFVRWGDSFAVHSYRVPHPDEL